MKNNKREGREGGGLIRERKLINFLPLKRGSLLERGGLFERGGAQWRIYGIRLNPIIKGQYGQLLVK